MSIYDTGAPGVGGSIYESPGTSSGGSIYEGKTSAKKKKKTINFPIGIPVPHIVSNLGSDIESTIMGLGPQLVDLARGIGESAAYYGTYFDPKLGGKRRGSTKRLDRIVEGVGKQYAYQYGPLLHGNLDDFWQKFEEHPLGPFLDFLTIATVGTGSAVKGAAALERAGVISKVPKALKPAPTVRTLASPRIKVAQELEAPWGGTYQTLPVTGGELARRLKLGTDAAFKKLPPNMRVLGEYARFGRAVNHSLAQSQAGSLLKVLPWYKISAKLSREEGIALTLRSQFPTEGLLKSYQGMLMRSIKEAEKKGLAPWEKKWKDKFMIPKEDYVKIMSDPKVLKYFREPSENMIQARMVAQEMDAAWVNALVSAGAMTRDQAEWIRWEPVLVAMGAKYKTLSEAELADYGISLKLAEAKNFKLLTAPPEFKVWRNGELVQGTLDDMIEQIKQEIRNNSPEMKALKAQMAKTKVAPENVDQLNEIGTAMTERAPSVFDEPMYFPHVSELKDIRIPRAGGGMVYPKSPVEIRSGVLQAAGRMILDPQVWTMKFLENAKFLYYREKHANLINAAVPMSAEELPKGWRFVTRKNERMAQIERTSGSFDEYLTNLKKELGEDPFEALGKTGTTDDLITVNANEAYTLTAEEAKIMKANPGDRLAIPERTAKQIIGDYTRSVNPAYSFLRNFTTVWRALVLNLRVGWLTNNILGNTLLYSIRAAGPQGLKSFVQAVGDAFGEAGVRKLWNDDMVRSHLTPKDMIEFFPEQYVGTFFGTQIPTYGRLAGMKAFTGKYSPFRALRSVDVHYEQALRRAMINKLVQRSPEFRKVWNEIPQTTRTIREAQRKALQRNPRLVRRVSQEVNDSLGDFFNMSNFERRVLRGAAPFYAWYRAITTIMIKMPLNHPFRTQILANLGRLGNEISADDYGLYYLQGRYPLDINTTLGTKSANPYTTPVDIAHAVGALAFGNRTKSDYRTLEGLFNPGFYEPLAGIARAAQGQNYQPGLGIVPAAGFEIVRGLPQVTLFNPYPSTLYNNQTQLRNLLQYLGIVIKDVNPAEAQKRGKQERP